MCCEKLMNSFCTVHSDALSLSTEFTLHLRKELIDFSLCSQTSISQGARHQTRLQAERQTASRTGLLAELQSIWHTREKDKQPATSSALVQHLHKSRTIFKDACVSTLAIKVTDTSFLESVQSKSTVQNNLFFFFFTYNSVSSSLPHCNGSCYPAHSVDLGQPEAFYEWCCFYTYVILLLFGVHDNLPCISCQLF